MSKMTRQALNVIIAYFLMGLTNAAFIDSLPKCSIKDSKCQKQLFQDSLKKIHKTGIPEVGIPPIDPIHLQDVSLSVLNLVNLTLVDGVAKGIKNCVFNKFEIDMEKGSGNQELVCDILIKGHYRLDAASPLLESLLGGSQINGDGNGKVKIEKLKLELNYPLSVIKKEDGEIYFNCEYNEIPKFDILGKVSFAGENIYLEKQDVSDVINQYLNENWKIIVKLVGPKFISKASSYYSKFLKSFFDSVPAKYYIIEDLTPYLKE